MTKNQSAADYCQMGIQLRWENSPKAAIACLEKALQLEPKMALAHQHLCGILRDFSDLETARRAVDKYCELCGEDDPIITSICYISIYLVSGLSQEAIAKFLWLEKYLYENVDFVPPEAIKPLYENFLYTSHYLRDSLAENSKLYRTLTPKYLSLIGGIVGSGGDGGTGGAGEQGSRGAGGQGSGGAGEQGTGGPLDQGPLDQGTSGWSLPVSQSPSLRLLSSPRPPFSPSPRLPVSGFPLPPIRIGFLSNHFYRHSVGWCSYEIIRELAAITPHVFLYFTGKVKPDDITEKFKNIAKFYQPESYPTSMADSQELIEKMAQDKIDVLIDLDSITVPLHIKIFQAKPAKYCISWLGFDAPFASESNYFLADWHSIPEGQEKYYCEQVLRMPHSFVAVSGFVAAHSIGLLHTRNLIRKGLRISPDQIIYYCVAPGRKFNLELVRAQVQILAAVRDGVLVYKGRSDRAVIESAYEQECQRQGVSFHRVKFLPLANTEEEHRKIYSIADVFLDSYPYNGGTHTLEALWFNLPVVTRVGEQFLSRMGNSFLQSLGVSQGIAQNWDEYVNWGIRLGKDIDLRDKIKQHLIQSKHQDNRAPLWNPRQFARNMYDLFTQL
ncbi:hypothetical protein [[Phormidium] sp. ETS-05]|uniref:O-linked N-acetylglucosamine transferase, SPINDLY family protein n=1 Tax=[Phormidium] sp. ETS-05 TaxID=222819 RepID=UPI0018EF33DD|nr:hypothetical protein [[Phormidium] sp. ETS-05]